MVTPSKQKWVLYVVSACDAVQLYLTFHICKLNYFDILCNISFKEHLPEDGLTMWPKHVVNCTVYNTINLHICTCSCWSLCLTMNHQCMVMNHLKKIYR